MIGEGEQSISFLTGYFKAMRYAIMAPTEKPIRTESLGSLGKFKTSSIERRRYLMCFGRLYFFLPSPGIIYIIEKMGVVFDATPSKGLPSQPLGDRADGVELTVLHPVDECLPLVVREEQSPLRTVLAVPYGNSLPLASNFHAPVVLGRLRGA